MLRRVPLQNIEYHICAYLTFFKTASHALNFNEFESLLQLHFHDSSLYDGIARPSFIRVSSEFLFHEALKTVSTEPFIFFIDDTQPITQELLAQILQLRQQGLRIALCIQHVENADTTLYQHFDYTLYDVHVALEVATLHHPFAVINIDTQQQYETLLTSAEESTLLGGSFFTTPTQPQVTPYFSDVLSLLNVLESQEDINKIATEFSHYPAIVLELLQYLNSSHFSLQKEVSSIKHALILLGRLQLRRWLLLLALDHSLDSLPQKETILFQNNIRIALMQSIATRLDYSGMENTLFAALLSTLEKSLGLSLQQILQTITLNDEIKDAITLYEGKIGTMLALTIAIEQSDLEHAIALAQELNIDIASLQAIINSAHE